MIAKLSSLCPTDFSDDATERPIPIPALLRWRVGTIEGGWVTVAATDWLSALGAALYRLGACEGLRRMACEVLPNGDIIANDVGRHRRFMVQRLTAAVRIAPPADLPPEAIAPVDDEDAITERFDPLTLTRRDA